MFHPDKSEPQVESDVLNRVARNANRPEIRQSIICAGFEMMGVHPLCCPMTAEQDLRSRFKGSDPFVSSANDLPVPFGNGNLLSGRRDPVPERLHEIDLLVDREIVEPWRRSGDYLGHGKNSYDREYIVNRRSRKADK